VKHRRVDSEERQSIEYAGHYIVRQPRVTVRVSGLCSSADEAYIFAAAPKTSETQQRPRATGRPRWERLPATELRSRALSDGDELFSTLLLQISIGAAEVVRVVEVPGNLPQFSHLLWKAFDYDAAADIFVVGSRVLVNPFPALQSWPSSSVAPIHAARPHTTWEHKHRGLVHPHPQAHAFQELPPAENDPPYSLASCACFARIDDVGLCIISVTQRTSLNLVWRREWARCPGGPWRGGDYFGHIASDTYQWLSRSGAVQGMPFVSRWALQENFKADPAAFVRLAQATAATSNPYEVWNRECEQQAMSDADVAATRYEHYLLRQQAARAQEQKYLLQQLAARVRDQRAMFLEDNDVMHAPIVQRSWQISAGGRQTCVTKGVSWIVPRTSGTQNKEEQCYGLAGFDHEDPGRREIEQAQREELARACMQNEDTDVRFDSAQRNAALCWGCGRPFFPHLTSDAAHSSIRSSFLKNSLAFNLASGRGPFEHYCAEKHPLCDSSTPCMMCSDCWVYKAADGHCPLCGVNISHWRVSLLYDHAMAQIGRCSGKSSCEIKQLLSRGIQFYRRTIQKRLLKKKLVYARALSFLGGRLRRVRRCISFVKRSRLRCARLQFV
jgi:hypothetical protein